MVNKLNKKANHDNMTLEAYGYCVCGCTCGCENYPGSQQIGYYYQAMDVNSDYNADYNTEH